MPQHDAEQQPGPIATTRSARVAASRKLLRRSARRDAAAFLADGPQSVREALTYHRAEPHPKGLRVRVSEVYVDAQLTARHADLLALARAAAVRIVACDAKAIASLSEAVTPQGIVARCDFLDHTLADLLTGPSQDRRATGSARLIAVPVDVRDPGNLGTIIRCADAAGADGVAILGDSVDLYNAKTVRSTAGSIFHLPTAVEQDPIAGIAALKAAGLRVIATEGEASADLDELIDAGGLDGPIAWLFGNEAHGLADDVAAMADERVRIPIRGLAESLNLSTAAAVCLFASARAHR